MPGDRKTEDEAGVSHKNLRCSESRELRNQFAQTSQSSESGNAPHIRALLPTDTTSREATQGTSA